MTIRRTMQVAPRWVASCDPLSASCASGESINSQQSSVSFLAHHHDIGDTAESATFEAIHTVMKLELTADQSPAIHIPLHVVNHCRAADRCNAAVLRCGDGVDGMKHLEVRGNV